MTRAPHICQFILLSDHRGDDDGGGDYDEGEGIISEIANKGRFYFGFWFPPRMRHCANYSSSPPPHCQPTQSLGIGEKIQISMNRIM